MSALLGISDPVRFVDPLRGESILGPDIQDRLGPKMTKRQDTLRYTIGIIVITALIFISIVALFDTLRTYINKLYIQSEDTTDEDYMMRVNRADEALSAHITFSIITLLIAGITIPLLYVLLI